jgi:8-oxo-dGTP diphosphatase
VALVHRPRHDDWSLPKGKALPGEHLLVTALREVEEETGVTPRLGPFLARFRYPLPRRRRIGAFGRVIVPQKDVSYWAMRAASAESTFSANREVDDVAWLSVETANQWLSYDLDRQVLAAFVALPPHTTALLVVRAGSSGSGARDRATRPLDERGVGGAEQLVPVLCGAGVTRLYAAPVAACAQTLQAFAVRSRTPVEFDDDLDSTEPAALDAAVDRLLGQARAGSGVAVCVDGPTVTPLLSAVAAKTGDLAPVERDLRPGEWWLVHVAGERLVALERHAPAA